MIIKSVTIENFAGTQGRTINFDDARTILAGANECGKTTVANAIMWLFTDKSLDGSQAKNIRPHGADGKDVDHVVTAVEVETEDYTFRKEQRQKWTKKRGTDEMVYGGLVNSYFINGVEKKERDFNAFVEGIVPTDALLYGMSAKAFTALDTKNRRAKLIPLAEVTDAEVIASNDAFKEVAPLLAVGTVAEIVTAANRAIKGYDAKIKEIPTRIDELSKTTRAYEDGDSAEEVKRLKLEADKVRAQISNMDADIKEYQKSSDDAFAAEFDLTTLRQKLLADYRNRKEGIDRSIRAAQSEMSQINGLLASAKRGLLEANEQIHSYQAEIADAKKSIEAVSKRKHTFPDYVEANYVEPISEVCPTCGRPFDKLSVLAAKKKAVEDGKERYEAAKKQSREVFDEVNKKDISVFDGVIANYEGYLKAANERSKQYGAEVKKCKERMDAADKEIKLLTTERNALVEPDIEANEEVIVAKAEIAKLRAEAEKGKVLSDKRFEAQNILDNLNRNADRMTDRMKSVDSYNEQMAARIKTLEAERAEYIEKEMAETRKRDLVKAFEIARIKAVTDKLNSRFKYVKWQMFAEQVNGGFADVCIPTVGGTSYDGLLNHGNRLLAELDIAEAFQNFYGVKLPLILDDAESVDAERIPQTDRQLIILRREGDKGSPLTVKKGA